MSQPAKPPPRCPLHGTPMFPAGIEATHEKFTNHPPPQPPTETTAMTPNPVLEKIKKLLRLAKDSAATAAEAATALTKAIALAEANGIDIHSVKFSQDATAGLTHTTEASQAGPAHRLASWLVQQQFGVETLFDKTTAKASIHFIGLEINCQLAHYAYVYLVRSMRQAWRKRTNRRLRDREAFLTGYAHAIARLMPRVFRNEGLILSAKAYVQSELLGPHDKLTTLSQPGKDASPRAFEDGYAAGRKAGIRNPIERTGALELPLH